MITPNPLFDTTTLAEYTAAGGESDSPKNQRIRDQLVRRNVERCCSGLIDTLVMAGPDLMKKLDIDFEDLASVLSQGPGDQYGLRDRTDRSVHADSGRAEVLVD